MKLNNKGFTLVEVLAVIVILSILMAIMVPSVSNILKKNRENNYKDLKSSIVSAAKVYLSDNRYEVTISSCINNKANITSINDIALIDSKLKIKTLVDAGNLKTTSAGKILNPKDKTSLDLNNSYIIVRYLCNKKSFEYELENNNKDYLVWQ